MSGIGWDDYRDSGFDGQRAVVVMVKDESRVAFSEWLC